MLEREKINRRRHRYWPFNRYAGCWWQHPYCQLPSLMGMGKPTPDEEEENLKDYNNILENVLNFAKRFKN